MQTAQEVQVRVSCVFCRRIVSRRYLKMHLKDCENAEGKRDIPRHHLPMARKLGGLATSKDRDHMRRLGQKGGAKTSQDRAHMSAIGKIGGAKVSQNRDHMRRIGSLGGKARHK